MNNSKLTIYVKKLIKENELNISKEIVIKCLCECIENIVFNIVSIASIIAFINNEKMITKETINILKTYINNNCKSNKKQTGGNSITMPMEFYGINSGRYLATNNITDVLNIDYTNGILRQQIGGGGKISPFVNVIKNFLNYYKIRGNKEVINEMVIMIEIYIKCLMMKLKKIKGDIKKSTIKTLIEKNKMFKIFK